MLPFVLISDDTTNCWNVKSTGNWAADNKIGRSHGEACIAYMNSNDNPALLFAVVEAMHRSSAPFSGIECGFFQAIAERVTSQAVYHKSREERPLGPQ